jgi:hypothetical protein
MKDIEKEMLNFIKALKAGRVKSVMFYCVLNDKPGSSRVLIHGDDESIRHSLLDMTVKSFELAKQRRRSVH